MGLRSTHKTDKNAETNGVWLAVDMNDHNNEPIEIKVARMGRTNKNYTKALDLATKPYSASIQNETMPTALADKLMRKVFIQTILLDWKNLPKSELTGKEDDADLLDFTPENAMALFEALPGVYEHWEELAKKTATFRETELEGEAGN